MIPRKIYLAIKHDCHYDDEYISFVNAADAMTQCYTWKTTGSFEDKDFLERDVVDCHFYAGTMNGDYSIYIQVINLME